MRFRSIRIDVQTMAQQIEGRIGMTFLALYDGIEEELVVLPLLFCRQGFDDGRLLGLDHRLMGCATGAEGRCSGNGHSYPSDYAPVTIHSCYFTPV